mgnify:CR=1 FL=1
MYLVLDTESIGFKTEKHSLVQLSYYIFDIDRNIIKESDSLVSPDGWSLDDWEDLPFDWNQDDCIILGEPLDCILQNLLKDIGLANYIIAHNIDFDLELICKEFNSPELNSEIEQKVCFCTMKESVDLCKIPFFSNRFKFPSLIEAINNLTNVEIDFQRLHNAKYDAYLCSELFFAVLDKKKSYF